MFWWFFVFDDFVDGHGNGGTTARHRVGEPPFSENNEKYVFKEKNTFWLSAVAYCKKDEELFRKQYDYIVFDIGQRKNLKRIVMGERIGTLVS